MTARLTRCAVPATALALALLPSLLIATPAAASIPREAPSFLPGAVALPSLPTLAESLPAQAPPSEPNPFIGDAKTRVRGFGLGLSCLVGGEAVVTCGARRGYELAYGGTASDRLLNAKARYYDPKLGRFLTQDSYLGQIDNPPSLHRYFYANDNPVRYVDPTGHGNESAVSPAVSQETIRAWEEYGKKREAEARATGATEGPLNAPEPAVVVEEDHGPLGNIMEPALEGAWWLIDNTVGRLTRWWDERGQKVGVKARETLVSQKPSQEVLSGRKAMTKGLPPEILAVDQGTQGLGTGVRETVADVAEEGTRAIVREGGVTLTTMGMAKSFSKAGETVELLSADAQAEKRLVGTQNPETAWAAKTGRAYDRRVTRFWRQYEGRDVGGWKVESVNRRLAPGIQPDLVLVNEESKTIVIHDVTSKASSSHKAKGAGYQRYFEAQRPGYTVQYGEGYWEGLENSWEALDRNGSLYLPGNTKP